MVAAVLPSEEADRDVARAVGWLYERRNRGTHYAFVSADSARVKRTLGLLPDRKNGHATYRQLVDIDTMTLLAEAIGVAPWEVLPDDDE